MAKRKPLPHRTASGQLSRAGVAKYSPAQIRRALDSLIHAAGNPLAGYEIGRLHLAGHLTAEHVVAARRYADLWSLWSRVHGVPQASARAMDIGAVRGLGTDEIDAERADAIKGAYWSAYDTLIAVGGDRLAQYVFEVVVQDRAACTEDEKNMVAHGLDALHSHWGGQKKAA